MVQATLRKKGSDSATTAQAVAAAVTKTSPVIDVQATVTSAAPAPQTDFQASLTGDAKEATQTASPTPAAASATPTPTPPRNTSRALQPASMNGGGSLEGFSTDDIKFPTMKIVNGNGPLSEKFHQGTVIFADELLLSPPPMDKPGQSLRFIPVTLKKRFRENLSNEEYKAGQKPRVVDTVQQVEELGGTYVWQNQQKPSWSPTATCFLLVERPEGSDHPAFSLEFNGKQYAPAVYYAGGGAYTDFAKPIISASALTLQVDIGKDATTGRLLKAPMVHKRVWTLTVKKVLKGQNYVFSPIIKLTNEETTEDLRDFCTRMSGSAAEAEADE